MNPPTFLVGHVQESVRSYMRIDGRKSLMATASQIFEELSNGVELSHEGELWVRLSELWDDVRNQSEIKSLLSEHLARTCSIDSGSAHGLSSTWMNGLHHIVFHAISDPDFPGMNITQILNAVRPASVLHPKPTTEEIRSWLDNLSSPQRMKAYVHLSLHPDVAVDFIPELEKAEEAEKSSLKEMVGKILMSARANRERGGATN